ncbi:MAG: hypothetical protein ACOC1P_00640 [Minisyncoccales bacterium]
MPAFQVKILQIRQEAFEKFKELKYLKEKETGKKIKNYEYFDLLIEEKQAGLF